ncbi:hypothetical protein ACFSM5_21165 [Lacibacterium aquatile]|uniref:Uncharacterized protein n=1 Tax=Lacibacterium aquatile TaxID=1168082 RepID=A0ABW5DZN0_9PROT
MAPPCSAAPAPSDPNTTQLLQPAASPGLPESTPMPPLHNYAPVLELSITVHSDGGFVVEFIDLPVIGSDFVVEGLRRLLPEGWAILVDAAELNVFQLYAETDSELLRLLETLAALNDEWAQAPAAAD